MSRIAKRRAKTWNEKWCPAIEIIFYSLATIIGAVSIYVWAASLILIFG